MTLTDIELRLRMSLTELTSTTPLVNPDHPRERATVVHASGGSPDTDIGLTPDGNRSSPIRRSSRSMRLVVGAGAALIALAGFTVAIVYGPRSSINGGSRIPTALTPSAHLAATVELRAGDLPGWSGYDSPPPDPAIAMIFDRCMGSQNPLRSPHPVGTAQSRQFSTENLTDHAQSFTYVMATVAQAKQLTSRDRQTRFPTCYADQTAASIAANLESSQHVVGQKVLGVGPAPPGVNQSDSLTVSTSYSVQQEGATGIEQTLVRLTVVRIGRTVTNLVVSASETAGPFPAALFNRLAILLSNRLASASRTAVVPT